MGNAYQPRHTIIATAFALTVLAACGGTLDTTDSSNENPSVATSGNDAPNGSVNDSDNPAPENAVEPLACATDSFDLDHGNQLFRFIFLYDDKRQTYHDRDDPGCRQLHVALQEFCLPSRRPRQRNMGVQRHRSAAESF